MTSEALQEASSTVPRAEADLVARKNPIEFCSNRDTGKHDLKVALLIKVLKNVGHDCTVKLFPKEVSKGVGRAVRVVSVFEEAELLVEVEVTVLFATADPIEVADETLADDARVAFVADAVAVLETVLFELSLFSSSML